MKTFVAAALISLASVATAQLDNIPSCALSCFITPLGSDGCASLTDFACHCKKYDSLIASVTPCVQKACSASDQASVIKAVEGTCAAAGVPVSVSSSIASSTSAAASSAPASASSTSAPSSAASSASAVVSSMSSAMTSAMTSAMSSVSAAPTASHNGSSTTASARPSASQFPGAASHFAPAAGVLGAAAAAFFVL